MSEFKQYTRKSKPAEMRPYVDGEDMTGISVSQEDRKNWNNVEPGFISRNPDNHNDQWYVAKKWAEDNFNLDGNNSGKDWEGIYNELLKVLHYHYDPEYTPRSREKLEGSCEDGYDYGVQDGYQALSKNLLELLRKQQENN